MTASSNLRTYPEVMKERVIHRFEPTCLVVEKSQVAMLEGDEPNLIAQLLDPHVLTASPSSTGTHFGRSAA